MYVVAVKEVIYDEQYIIKEMLETGEYGINAHPISHEAIVEFIRDREWGLDTNDYLSKCELPTQISVQDEDGEALFFASTLREVANV
jgi:hypothetical protein